MSDPDWALRALDAAVELARRSGAAALALVGSWARADARPDSDLDLVLLVEDPERLLTSTDWFGVFGEGVHLVRAGDFGALQERRLLTADGHEIEVCLGRPGWAAVEPVDEGTAAVVRGGMRALHDPHGLLSRLLAAVVG